MLFWLFTCWAHILRLEIQVHGTITVLKDSPDAHNKEAIYSCHIFKGTIAGNQFLFKIKFCK